MNRLRKRIKELVMQSPSSVAYLADVTGALPVALGHHGIGVRTLVPGYPAVLSAVGKARKLARYDDLFNGKEEKIDVSQVAVSMNGIELQDREFFAAIREGREPNASIAQVLPSYRVLHQLEQQLNAA